MSNSIQLDQLYGIPGLKMLGIVGFSEEDMAESGLAYDPLPGCSSDERYQQNWTNGNYIAVAVFSTLGLLLLAILLVGHGGALGVNLLLGGILRRKW